MKKLLLLLIFVIYISFSFAQSFVEKEIRDYMEKSARNWSSGNLEEFMAN